MYNKGVVIIARDVFSKPFSIAFIVYVIDSQLGWIVQISYGLSKAGGISVK